MQTNEIRIQDYIGVIYRKKLVVVLSFLLIFGVSLYYAYITPAVYLSAATVSIDTRSLSTPTSKGGTAIVTSTSKTVDYYERIFTTNIFRMEVTDSLKANTDAWVAIQRQNTTVASLVDNGLLLEADAVQTFFKITAVASEPMIAYQLARISSELFQKKIKQIESESSQEGNVYLSEKIEVVRDKLEESNIQIQRFAREHGIVPTVEKDGGDQGVMDLQTKLDVIQIQRELTQTRLRRYYQRKQEILNQKNIKILNPNLDDTLQEFRRIATLTDSLEMVRTDLTSTLGQTHPDVIEINKRIRDNQLREKEINSQIGVNAVGENQEQLPSLQTKIVEAEQSLFEMNSDVEYYEQKLKESNTQDSDEFSRELEFQRLMHAKALFETRYDALVQLQEEEQFQKATQSGGVKMIDPATFPNQPLPSTTPRKVLFGAIIGLSLGLGAAFLLEYMDSSLKTSEDVSRFLNIPLIGEIPRIKDIDGKKSFFSIFSLQGKPGKEESYNPRLITNFSPKEPIPESYRNVRTSLQYSFAADPLRCFVISSPNASEGKSLTTANVAIGFAQSGKKTLIIDTDLRRPVIHKIFGLVKEPGITDVLINQVSLHEAIKPTAVEGLYILPAGHSTPNPGELIGSDRMNELLAQLKQEMDIILMDSPPVIAAIDSAILSAKTQGVLLVFNMDETKREAASFCIEQIKRSGGNVIGGILNNIDVDRRYGYYYGNRYYYRYKYYSKYYYGEESKATDGQTVS